MHYLHQAMYASVGAASAEGRDAGGSIRAKAGQRRFKMVLNRIARTLALPAAVVLAAVAQTQGDPAAQCR
jgi:hypothetical protein